MPAQNWYQQILTWLFNSPDTLSVHFCMLVMFASAKMLRRSLGSGPVWWSTFFGALIIESFLLLSGVVHAPWPLGLLNMLAMPSLIFLLARAQTLPGLRRGEMTSEQRKRWIVTQALAPEPVRARKPYIYR